MRGDSYYFDVFIVCVDYGLFDILKFNLKFFEFDLSVFFEVVNDF